MQDRLCRCVLCTGSCRNAFVQLDLSANACAAHRTAILKAEPSPALHAVQLFRIAQLMLEFVLFGQEELLDAKDAAEARLSGLEAANAELVARSAELNDENKKRRRLISSYQRMVDDNRLGPHT